MFIKKCTNQLRAKNYKVLPSELILIKDLYFQAGPGMPNQENAHSEHDHDEIDHDQDENVAKHDENVQENAENFTN